MERQAGSPLSISDRISPPEYSLVLLVHRLWTRYPSPLNVSILCKFQESYVVVKIGMSMGRKSGSSVGSSIGNGMMIYRSAVTPRAARTVSMILNRSKKVSGLL